MKKLLYLIRKISRKHGILHLSKRILGVIFYRYVLFKRYLAFRIIKARSKDRFVLKDIQGSMMYLDKMDSGISKELALDRIREVESTKTIKKIIKEGDVVVDIGANIGYYLLMESKIVGKNGKIYGIEPVPSNVKIIEKNVKANNYKNIEIFQMAIGDKNGKTKINISRKSNWHSILYSDEIEATYSIDVDIITLDEFLKKKEHPDFVRMDVEGYEYNIISGMRKTLKSKRPLKIFIELHPHLMGTEKTSFILNELKNNGFEITNISKSWTRVEYIVRGRPINYNFRKIDDLLKNELFLSGKLGAFETFFERE